MNKDISTKVQNYLTSYPYCIPRTTSIFKEFSNYLLNYLNRCYFTPLLYKDHMQAVEKSHITTSIRQKIKKQSHYSCYGQG